MLHFLDKYKLIKGQAAFGVELVFSTKDSYTLIAIELASDKETLVIKRRFIDITWEELVAENKKNLPVYITIGGKGIIHKKVKVDEYTKEQELLNQVLPNASLNDFYLQKSLLSDYECWISIIRKDLLGSIITKVENLNLFGVQVYLGPFIIYNCIPLIDQPAILTTTHELLIENNKIIQLDNLESVSTGDEYNIEGELVNSHELIAFGTALSHFILPNELIPFSVQKINLMKDEYLNKNKYTIIGFSFLSLFFVLTILNLLLNNSYQTTNNELQNQLNSKKKYIVQLKKDKEDLKVKEQFIQNSGIIQASKVSYYADQIALSVPKSIRLNQLFINPLQKRINKAEDIHFNFDKIRIMGGVNKSIELNNWVKELKKYKWIAGINIISFIQENLTTAGEFEIEITLDS